MDANCIKCKGRLFCGRSFCPIKAKQEAKFNVKEKIAHLKKDFLGDGVSCFVGHFGYPNLNVGILTPTEKKDDSWLYEAPKYWSKENFGVADVINLRSDLINSKFKVNIKQQNKLIDLSKEIAMASKPADVEINLKKKPDFKLNMVSDIAPTGPNAILENAKLVSNTKVDTRVEKAVEDNDLKAADAVVSLYQKGFDENFLSRMLSIGNLGIGFERKIVPTRWSITATDDIIGKNFISEIKHNEKAVPTAYFGGYLGNYYLIMVFPEIWQYELFEMYMPKASWNVSEQVQYSTDYEPYSGRKTYASETVGGYYTVRLAVLEKLKENKKQGTILALRFITGDYFCPLGVWVTREAARKAMQNPIEFETKELMLNYARMLIKKKFHFDIDLILRNSKVLDSFKQRKLMF